MRYTIFVTLCLMTVRAVPACADGAVDAKMQCQVEYGADSDMGAACKEGVEIARRAAPNSDALGACTAGRNNGAQISACQQGVTLFGRFAGQVRSSDKSSFSYTWTQPKTGFQVEIGEVQASVGNQKAVDDCMRAFEGSDAPPSCMSGITVQQKPPAPVKAP